MTENTNAEWIKFLEEEHKIKPEVWKKYRLTFDDKFLYIPIKNPKTDEVKLKRRQLPSLKAENKYLNPKGLPITLYPDSHLSGKEEIVLCEGELDSLTLESYGISSITAGGVTGFKKEFLPLFSQLKKIFLAFDNDEAGQNGAVKVANLLSTLPNLEIFILDIPQEPDLKDVGDFFKLGKTKEDFSALIYSAKKFEKKIDSGTKTPLNKPKVELIERELTYKEIEEKVEQLLPGSKVALKILLAVAVSGCFRNDLLLWVLFVGVPSSGKTILVRLIQDATLTYYLDTLTQNAFISGEGRGKVFDLLSFLDLKCLIIKDWTAIFSHDEKVTKKILGDLVGIYDKEFTKFSSQRGAISFSSEFSQIGCITPAALNKHTQYMNMVGPRFLCYIVPELSSERRESAFEAIFSGQDRSKLEKETKLYVSSYLEQLSNKKVDIKSFSKDIENYLKLCAELIANCRGIAVVQNANFTDTEGNNVNYYELQDVQVEEPWRALQQLISLAKYLAFVQDKNEVGVEELQIIKDIALSSMPANRAQVLSALIKQHGTTSAKKLSGFVDKSQKTSRRLLDELSGLKVVEKTSGSDGSGADYSLSDKFRDFLLVSSAEFLSLQKDQEGFKEFENQVINSLIISSEDTGSTR